MHTQHYYDASFGKPIKYQVRSEKYTDTGQRNFRSRFAALSAINGLKDSKVQLFDLETGKELNRATGEPID